MYDLISTPSVVVELEQVTENLKKMDALNRTYGILVRPHIKPHKSVYFALEQLSCGARGITCAKLSEAETMADYGIDDIFIAYPLIGEDKMERLGRLMQRIRVSTEVNSIYGAKQLSALGERIGKKVPVLIEIDGGLHRGGVPPYEGAVAFADSIRDLPGLEICGLMYYGGLIYAETTREGYEAQTKREHDELVGTAELLRAKGYRMDVLSGGNSYSARCCKYLEGITEVRCGNYIFNDVATLGDRLCRRAGVRAARRQHRCLQDGRPSCHHRRRQQNAHHRPLRPPPRLRLGRRPSRDPHHQAQ